MDEAQRKDADERRDDLLRRLLSRPPAPDVIGDDARSEEPREIDDKPQPDQAELQPRPK